MTMAWVGLATAVVGAGATVYGSRQAAKAGRQTKTQSAIEQMGFDNMKALNPYGLDFLKKGQGNIDVFDKFYKTLASGNREEALKLLAPEFRTMDQMSATSAGSAMSLAPRSGGSGETRLQLRDQNQAAKNDTLVNLRTNAVDKLGALGGEQVSLGSSFLGQNAQSGMGLLGAIQSRQNSQFEQSRAAGQGMFDIMKLLGTYGWQAYQSRRQATPAATGGNVKQFAPSPPVVGKAGG